MMYYHNFLVDVSRYAELGKDNDFPELDCCPMCRARNRLQRHGFYERNAIETEASTYRVTICRLICPDCKKTVSIRKRQIPHTYVAWLIHEKLSVSESQEVRVHGTIRTVEATNP